MRRFAQRAHLAIEHGLQDAWHVQPEVIRVQIAKCDGGPERKQLEADMWLDIVFIMLIFFIVTTSFIKESGLPVHGLSDKPTIPNPEPVEAVAVRIEDGNIIIRIDGRVVAVSAVAANERLLVDAQDRPIIVLAGDHSDASTLVAVIDAVRQTGVESAPVARLAD